MAMMARPNACFRRIALPSVRYIDTLVKLNSPVARSTGRVRTSGDDATIIYHSSYPIDIARLVTS